MGAIMNCADNTGAKNLYIISVKGYGGRLNRVPQGTVGSMFIGSVKKGKPELRKKGALLIYCPLLILSHPLRYCSSKKGVAKTRRYLHLLRG